jgi:hypothetical protein
MGGMGKLLLAALLGGVVAALVTFFVATSLVGNERRAETDARLAAAEKAVRDADEKAEVAAKRSDLLQKRLDAATRETTKAVARLEEQVAARPAPSADGAAAPGTATAPDGTPWVSRADLDRALAGARPAAGVTVGEPPKPVEQKPLEDIARDMGLSAAEEANVRNILRESEEEMVRSLFGDRPYAEIAAEVRSAKDDPEKMEQLVTDTVTRAIGNIGKLATLEARTKKKVEGVLGKDRATDLLRRPRKPLLGEEFERLFEGIDLN